MPRPISSGPVKFGPFMLESRLAVGGTAEVYLARPIDPKAQPRRLVVKRLLPQFVNDPEGRTMFEREAALHAAVRHENVVRIHAYGAEGDEPWLAMELIDGCDLFRLLRRRSGEGLGIGVAVYITRQLLGALDSVHSARDAGGEPMGIIHRDVTPSNVYLSNDGGVKLGDFGIARSLGRPTTRTTGSDMLKGKFAYLAPEQVAGESFDHRADLFAMAAVLSEMILGRPLFAGTGQLAVLLAIRDCRIDDLREARAGMPAGLFPVLERALSRDPGARFATARDFDARLAPFETNAPAARAELSALVRLVQAAPSVEQMHAVRESARKLRAETPLPFAAGTAPKIGDQTATGEYAAVPSTVLQPSGRRLGPWPFARLVEAIATGEVGRGDEIEHMGRELRPIEAIEELARFLPAVTPATSPVGVNPPDFIDEVSPAALVSVLLRVIERASTGVLFAEGPSESRRTLRADPGAGRKELYFVAGKLHHVASNNASELLGEYLVRRRVLSRDELDMALAVLPRYGGRMGDTLIALGLVGSLDIFRAIRDQGRDRLVDLFQWRTGKLTFYSGQTAPHVDFPLDLDLPALVFAGMEAAQPGETPLDAWRERLDVVLAVSPNAPPRLRAAPWPPPARRLLDEIATPRPLREVLIALAREPVGTASDALRAISIFAAAKLLTIG